MIILGMTAGIFITNYHNHTKLNYDENISDIQTTTEEEIYSDNIVIPCFDNMVLTANQVSQRVNFYNPEQNNGIDFQITLRLNDGTELWSSGLIPNGKAIYNITLNRPLEVGNYDAELVYQCYTKTKNKLNGSIVTFNLIANKGITK